jgi:hypothetical protein
MTNYSFSYYNVSFPEEFVLHVGNSPLPPHLTPEINRPESLNAFNAE